MKIKMATQMTTKMITTIDNREDSSKRKQSPFYIPGNNIHAKINNSRLQPSIQYMTTNIW
jgi:hypothetical protein